MVEVGLGGTWDCTNVVDGAVAVVTNISFDHTEVLGPTLEGIATDKAGIVKAGSTVVVGETDPGLVSVIRAVADGAGAGEVWVRGRGVRLHRQPGGGGRAPGRPANPGGLLRRRAGPPARPRTRGQTPPAPWRRPRPSSARRWTRTWWPRPSPRVGVPGRLEVVGRRPLCVVDGAHNVAGAEALGRALVEEFAVEGADGGRGGHAGRAGPAGHAGPAGPAGIATVVACAPASPRALPADVVAEAARVARAGGGGGRLGGRGGWHSGALAGGRGRPAGGDRLALRGGRRPGPSWPGPGLDGARALGPGPSGTEARSTLARVLRS